MSRAVGVPFDLLIRGGSVVDGTGAATHRADVGVRGSRIVFVGTSDAGQDSNTIIDASGSVVAPGFVDIHGHSDLAVLSAPMVPSKIRQGVTTEVMGNCGLSAAPLSPEADVATYRVAMATGDVDPSVTWDWRDVVEYRERVNRGGVSMNVALLAGHLPIRVAVVGYDARPATASELTAMQRIADRALAQGACGLSTGLSLAPMTSATPDELVALGEVAADHDKIFSFHMRDYTDHLLDAVSEVLDVARRTGCRVQVSHLAVIGRNNWGAVSDALAMIDDAVAAGSRVGVDVYPYVAGSGNLTQLLPDWLLEGGRTAQLQRLSDPGARARVLEEVGGGSRKDTWGDITISSGEVPEEVVGKSVAEISKLWNLAPAEVVVRLVESSGVTASMVAFGRSEDDVVAALRHPLTMIGSDGRALDPEGPSGQGKPHPRSYGCYPRVLGPYVRDQQVLSLEQAVHKATQKPAEWFGFSDRGVVAPGYVADLVVFDPKTIVDTATFTDPHRFSDGIRSVIVAGETVVMDGNHTGLRPGAFL
ncbi:MAG: D-aminoacylase [Acidimicrobiia bacterium]